jgi:hypothetical protein
MSIENQLREWVAIDDKLRIMYENIKELRAKKTSLTASIQNNLSANNNNNIQNTKLPIGDGHIKLVNTRINEPLTFAYLDKSLRGIIKNEQQVQIIIDHIKNSRSSKTITELKRF